MVQSTTAENVPLPTEEFLASVEKRAAELAQEQLGYRDVFDLRHVEADVKHIGGGYLISVGSSESFDELHVFTHGGIRLPRRFAHEMGHFDAEEMAHSIHRNRDSSTSALAMEMVRGLSSKQSPRRLIAYFDVARVFIDGNRIHVMDQMPEQPYSGIAALRRGLSLGRRIEIVEELWRPWCERVDQMIIDHGIRSVFHHHTYDREGTGQADHEHGPANEKRPAGMVCHLAPSSMWKLGRASLLNDELLDRVVGALRCHLGRLEEEAEVRVDWPYRAPEMPFLPRLDTSGSDYQTIIYEARKDLLAGENGLGRLTGAVEALSSQAAAHCGYA